MQLYLFCTFHFIRAREYKMFFFFFLQWSGMKKELPANVHLLTLEEFSDNTYLLRLENFYEKNEDATLSKDASVSLKVSKFSSLV